eukprot:GHVU01013061.1.p1 GENE.GHVU01013061.1~~GHVU01013061.1.p1  ORF type:complete len:316 (+),score=39.03 GHVU01013061.1:1825-2772(+)
MKFQGGCKHITMMVSCLIVIVTTAVGVEGYAVVLDEPMPWEGAPWRQTFGGLNFDFDNDYLYQGSSYGSQSTASNRGSPDSTQSGGQMQQLINSDCIGQQTMLGDQAQLYGRQDQEINTLQQKVCLDGTIQQDPFGRHVQNQQGSGKSLQQQAVRQDLDLGAHKLSQVGAQQQARDSQGGKMQQQGFAQGATPVAQRDGNMGRMVPHSGNPRPAFTYPGADARTGRYRYGGGSRYSDPDPALGEPEFSPFQFVMRPSEREFLRYQRGSRPEEEDEYYSADPEEVDDYGFRGLPLPRGMPGGDFDSGAFWQDPFLF